MTEPKPKPRSKSKAKPEAPDVSRAITTLSRRIGELEQRIERVEYVVRSSLNVDI